MSARKTLRTSNSPSTGVYALDNEVMTRIWLERLRQKQLIRDAKIKFDCSSPIVGDDRKLRVLTEELGEVARAIDRVEAPSVPTLEKAKEHLREELTQVAAVTIAWLEALK